MRRIHTLKKTTRFRYWTRKGYAAFASLGRCVTIGCLRKNVTERALTKQTEPSLAPQAQPTETEREAEAMPTLEREQRLLLLLIGAQTETTYPAEPRTRDYTLLDNINNGRDALNASCDFAPSLRRRVCTEVTRRIQCVSTYITHQE